jgi:hypothetical protein
MRKIYITFGGSVYDSITKKIVNNAPRLGADEVWVYDDLWLTKQDFYKHNKWLWDHPHKRGFGWYAWKPFIIIDALSRLEDGDIVLFTDADTYPIADLSPLYDYADKEGIMLFEASSEVNRALCKRDCCIVMAQDDDKYRDAKHAVARFMLFKKGLWKPYQLLLEWITYCVNPRANTFDPSILGPERAGFVEHRAEQAILTLLAHKYNYKLHREACQAGESNDADRDLYPQLFEQENPWNDKNKANITAPVQGSKYMNIPDRKTTATHSVSTRPNNASVYKKTVNKMTALWHTSKVKTKRKTKTIAFKLTPRKVKDAVKKIIK